MSRIAWIPLIALLCLIAGCAAEPEVPTIRKGGHFRVFNASGTPISATFDGNGLTENLASGVATAPRVASLDTHTLAVTGADISASVDFTPDSAEFITALVLPGGKVELVRGEPRESDNSDAKVVVVNATGETVEVDLDGMTGKSEAGTLSEILDVPVGIRTASMGDAKADMNIESGKAYTIFVYEADDKANLLVSENKPKMIPTAAATAPM